MKTTNQPLWALAKALCPKCDHDGATHFRLDAKPVCERVDCPCAFDYLAFVGYQFIPVGNI